MVKHDRALLQGAGLRLRKVREDLRFSRPEMAARLGIKPVGYYKNENGETFPSLRSLGRLQKDFNISMDWFIFNRGPMYFNEKQSEGKGEAKAPGGGEMTPEMKELFDGMEQDPLLRHEVLAYYYKYKKKEANIPVESPPEAV